MGQKCTTTGKPAPKLTRPQDDVIRAALFAAVWAEAKSLLININCVERNFRVKDRSQEKAARLHDFVALLGCPEFLEVVFQDLTDRPENADMKPYVAPALAMVEAVRQRVSA